MQDDDDEEKEIAKEKSRNYQLSVMRSRRPVRIPYFSEVFRTRKASLAHVQLLRLLGDTISTTSR